MSQHQTQFKDDEVEASRIAALLSLLQSWDYAAESLTSHLIGERAGWTAVTLLEAWKALEKQQPRAEQNVQEVTKLMPNKVKKRRLITGDDGEEQGWEEYYDYQFPDDRKAPMNLKILEMAHKWKQAGAPTLNNAGGLDTNNSGGQGGSGRSGGLTPTEDDEDRGGSRRDDEELPASKRARVEDSAEIDIDDM